jgi:large subunit ribosomal protein L25
MHVDLLRVRADTEVSVHVPIHFVNEAACPGVKVGGAISHSLIEVGVLCLPKDLPEAIEVDMADVNLGDNIHLSELTLPSGVRLAQNVEENDPIVVSVHSVKAAPIEGLEGEEGIPAPGEVPTTGEAAPEDD